MQLKVSHILRAASKTIYIDQTSTPTYYKEADFTLPLTSKIIC